MHYAIISVSKTGALLGAKVKRLISGDGTLYERKGSESGEEAEYFNRTFQVTADIFNQYDGLLFIMASGIVVRAIAPHVVSKASDPAVLVMDECGKHCISLLSGHLGGANDWCREVAAAVGADPVITTATDVHGKLAPDEAARRLMMRVEPLGALKPVNSIVAENNRLAWFIDETLDGAASIGERLDGLGISHAPLTTLNEDDFDGCAVITEAPFHCHKPFVILRPKNLFVGIGCKRGTPEELIEEAFEGALEKAQAYSYQVAALASVDLKKDEKGLLAFAEYHHFPIHFYTAGELKEISEEYQLASSPFVEKTIGVGNVCQTAALKESKRGKTLLPKTKFTSATVSIALGLSGSSASGRVMKRK